MWAVWIGAVLVLLKLFEVGPFATLSWWWVMLPLAVAFVFFEVIEPMFSLDKKKEHNENELYRKRRLEAQLKTARKKK